MFYDARLAPPHDFRGSGLFDTMCCYRTLSTKYYLTNLGTRTVGHVIATICPQHIVRQDLPDFSKVIPLEINEENDLKSTLQMREHRACEILNLLSNSSL